MEEVRKKGVGSKGEVGDEKGRERWGGISG